VFILGADFDRFGIKECYDPGAHAIFVGEFEGWRAKVGVSANA
jgi:hypothetical protein